MIKTVFDTNQLDYLVYNLTHVIVHNLLEDLTNTIDSDFLLKPHFRFIIAGGTATNIYAEEAKTHDWDTRFLLINKDDASSYTSLDFINYRRVLLLTTLTDNLNQKINQTRAIMPWFLKNIIPFTHQTATKVLTSGLQYFHLARYIANGKLELVDKNTSVNSCELLVVTCKIPKGDGFHYHSLIDNVVFSPNCGIDYYNTFIGSDMHLPQSPIPLIKIDGLWYPKFGFVLWDTCRMISEHTRKYNRYLDKFNSLLQTLQQVVTNCLGLEYKNLVNNYQSCCRSIEYFKDQVEHYQRRVDDIDEVADEYEKYEADFNIAEMKQISASYPELLNYLADRQQLRYYKQMLLQWSNLLDDDNVNNCLIELNNKND